MRVGEVLLLLSFPYPNTLAFFQGLAQFQKQLLPLFLSCFQDQVHAVRMTATRCLEPLVRTCGEECALKSFLPRLIEHYSSEGSSYLQRVTVVYALRELACCAFPAIVDVALPVLLRATRDPVPNVRTVAAGVLGESITAKVIPRARIVGDVRAALTALTSDSDADVRFAAGIALEIATEAMGGAPGAGVAASTAVAAK